MFEKVVSLSFEILSSSIMQSEVIAQNPSCIKHNGILTSTSMGFEIKCNKKWNEKLKISKLFNNLQILRLIATIHKSDKSECFAICKFQQ